MKLSAEFKDLVTRMVHPNGAERPLISDILMHSWMNVKTYDEKAALSALQEGLKNEKINTSADLGDQSTVPTEPDLPLMTEEDQDFSKQDLQYQQTEISPKSDEGAIIQNSYYNRDQ